jgi:L-seryl-tRNA(Ser) seleniumtransferase
MTHLAQDPKIGLLRAIPSVERLLGDPLVVEIGRKLPRWIVLEAARDLLAETRRGITEGTIQTEVKIDDLARRVEARAAARARRGIRKVINATGVVIHTNLGRSVLADVAIAAVGEVARSYSSLEFDLEDGARASRTGAVDGLVARIVGSEDAFVVNNNAGAVLIALSTLSAGKEAIVSRGELVEIGGSFRLPDVMEKSGARMVEVGTTNRTRIEDFEAAITGETAVILKVHPSNFAMTGFVEMPSRRQLAELARRRGLVTIEDLGSGALFDLAKIGITREPMPQESIADGIDVVTFSGDKLLGGPQAGLIAGRRDLVEKLRTDPLARALRIDKMTLAALEETLRVYLEPERLPAEIPTLRMLAMPLDRLKARAERAARCLSEGLGQAARVSAAEAVSQVGGGSLPLAEIATYVIAVEPVAQSANKVVAALRQGHFPVIARIVEDRVLMDLRTVEPNDDDLLVKIVIEAFRSDGNTSERS